VYAFNLTLKVINNHCVRIGKFYCGITDIFEQLKAFHLFPDTLHIDIDIDIASDIDWWNWTLELLHSSWISCDFHVDEWKVRKYSR